MKLAGNLVIIAASAAALTAMMLTNPDYNRAIRPFTTQAGADQTGQTRLIAGRVTGWRSADRITFPLYGSPVTRDSAGAFLIVEAALSGTTESTMLEASWIGTSGREYLASPRITGITGQIDDLWLQPGLTSKAKIFFELPPDEIAGGALRLSRRLDPDLDGVLLLAPPDTPPAHDDIASFPE